jgi:hypothetical protein
VSGGYAEKYGQNERNEYTDKAKAPLPAQAAFPLLLRYSFIFALAEMKKEPHHGSCNELHV